MVYPDVLQAVVVQPKRLAARGAGSSEVLWIVFLLLVAAPSAGVAESFGAPSTQRRSSR